jgi:hypothetical protein
MKTYGTYDTPCDAGDARRELKAKVCPTAKTRIEPAKGDRWKLVYSCGGKRKRKKR